MPKDFDVIAIGELNPDLILSGDVLPEFNQVEKLVDDATLAIGGSAAIFACAAARLGLRTAFIGIAGGDVFGNFMLSQLQGYGIDTSGISMDPHQRTGLSVILSRRADRAILTFPGLIPALRLADILPQLLARSRHLHLAGYYILDALRPDVPALFDLAHGLGVTVSLDTNYDPSCRWNGGLASALRRTDVFLPNAGEAQAITGKETVDAAAEILASQVRVVAVKRGAEGAVAIAGAQHASAPSLPVTVVDTVGAGDAFDAGFLFGFLSGWDLDRSLHLGCICGSLSTTSAGGTAAQPGLEQALDYL